MFHNYTAYFILSLFPLLCFAQETGSLHSKHASFDGNILTLSGNVELQHGLGTLLAEEATLTRQEAHRDFPFSHIELHKNVELFFKDRTKLSCAHAHLDFLGLKGMLFSERDPIVYIEKIGEKEIPLTIKAMRGEFACIKAPSEKEEEYLLTTIQAEQEVHVEYATQYELVCNHVLYDKTNKEHPILITSSNDGENLCRLTHGKDIIDAQNATLDVYNALLTLKEPQGSFVPTPEGNAIAFRARELLLDHQRHLLTLRNQVSLDEPLFGHLTTDDLLRFQGETSQADFQYAECFGNTILAYKNPNTEEIHELICHGRVYMDRPNHIAYFDSPERQDPIPESEQLLYRGKECLLFADHAIAEYAFADGRAALVRVHLKGRIRFRAPDMERTGIADRAMYSPLTRTLILFADPGNQVFFYDAKENVQMQAPEMHLVYDEEQNRTVAKGIGKVRFTLSEEELKQLLSR